MANLTKNMTIAQLAADLHKIYIIDLSGDFNNNVAAMKAYMQRNSLYFKEVHEVEGCEYWSSGAQVDDKFFDDICPGILLSESELLNKIEHYCDVTMWERLHASKPIINATKAA